MKNGSTSRNSVPDGGQACLTLQEMEMYANGSGDSEFSGRVTDHLNGCASCRAEVELLREFETAEPALHERADLDWVVARMEASLPARKTARTAPGTASPEASWWQRLFGGGTLAPALALAAMALFVVAGISFLRQTTPELGEYPGSGAGVLRSGAVRVLEPAGDVGAIPATLRWEPVSGAARYDVQLVEVDGTVIWRTDSSADSVALPESVREAMLPGKTLLWRITARTQSGDAVGAPTEQEFRLRRN